MISRNQNREPDCRPTSSEMGVQKDAKLRDFSGKASKLSFPAPRYMPGVEEIITPSVRPEEIASLCHSGLICWTLRHSTPSSLLTPESRGKGEGLLIYPNN